MERRDTQPSAGTHRTTATARPIDRVLAHLEGAHRSGAGWVSKCPNHDDRKASLSIKEGVDGRVLLHCFAACANVDVVLSAGLSFVDLFPPGSRERQRPRTWKGIVPMAGHGRPALESFGDAVTAAMLAEIARLAHVRGRLDTQFAGALRLVAAAVDVSAEQLREAVRDATDTESPA